MAKRYIILGVLIFLFLAACKNRSTDKEVSLTKDDITGFDQMEEVKDIYYRFPSPDEMLNFISRQELEFDDRILLPVENARGYIDSRSQALNLGVYSADLAYITLFQRQKEALTYFTIVYGLSDKLRISSAFDPELLKRFEDNLNNMDSLELLADEAMTDITNYLVENDKEKTFAVISIGGFIESMYLAFHLTGEFDEDNVIVQRISDQKFVLENLLNYSLEYSGDQNVAEAIKLLHPIRSVFNELTVHSEETDVQKTEDGKLIIKGGEKITISEEQFYRLRDITFKTRKIVTENLEN
jgi:hypothetical protein